jgi:hypothetical protein
MSNKYLLDTNIFIQAKNFRYGFEYCAAFWAWILEAHEGGVLFSVQKVKAEILRGDKTEPLVKWTKDLPSSFFLEDLNDIGVMGHYRDLLTKVLANKNYMPKALAEFAAEDEADAFLIATAKHGGYVLVSDEEPAANARKKVPLPDAAKLIGVKTIKPYQLYQAHAKETFKFKP